jgi:hypothetical protein
MSVRTPKFGADQVAGMMVIPHLAQVGGAEWYSVTQNFPSDEAVIPVKDM